MIFTDRTITVRKGESRIDEPIVVYRGDYELEVRFTILNSKFRFMSGTNLIESEKASYGQLAILTPYGGNIFSDVVRCNDGSVTFVLTAEMLNQIEEVGLYSFQIRLMDYMKESRVSIPPIEFGIEVREPIASEDHDNSVNNAIVGYSIAKVVDPKEEIVGDTFDEDGNYNKTKWETGDRISQGKLNKIEDAIDKVNKNEKDNTVTLSKRIDNNFNVLDAVKADKNEVFTMANMGQDVKEAMTGGSVAVVGVNAVNTDNIVDESVTEDKINEQIIPSRLCGAGTIRYSFESDHVKFIFPKYTHVIVGTKYYRISTDKTTINVAYPPAPNDGVNLIIFDTRAEALSFCNFRSFNNIKNNPNILVLGTANFYEEKSVYMNGDYAIDGSGVAQEEFHLTFEGEIVVDKFKKIIQIPPFYVMKYDMPFKFVSPGACGASNGSWYFEYPLPNGYDIHTIYLDYSSVMKWNNGITTNENPIRIAKTAAMPDVSSCRSTIPVIASMIYTHVTTKYPYKEIGGTDYTDWCTYNGTDIINFDWEEGVIEFSRVYNFIQYKHEYYKVSTDNMIDGYKLPISQKIDGVQWLLFNIDTKQLRTLHFLNEPIDWDQGWLIVATFWINHSVQIMGAYKINGRLFGEESQATSNNTSFTVSENKLLLPDKMYLVKGETLPIYLSSVIPNPYKIPAVKPSIVYQTDDISTNIDRFTDGYDINCDKLKNGFRMGYTQYVNSELYFKDISAVYCDPSIISNKTPVVLHIGDSITNRDIPYRSELFLNQWGISPTYVGTLNNGIRRGEGREGWEYTNFIGMSNIWGNNGSVINPDNSSATTDLNSNPFLKVATDNDKANHPDWCFTHTGVTRETDYSNSDDKQQVFYIFDIANYLTAHNVSKPNIITIALSTNDITRHSDYLQTCIFSMNVMIDRIREQLPDVKIGIVPSPAWGYGNNTFQTRTSVWIEECMHAISSRNDDNVFVVPIWCHMNREWGLNVKL